MSEETHCSQYEPPRQITSWPHCHSPMPSSFLFPCPIQSWPFQATSHNYFLFFYRSNCNRFNLIAKLMLGACSVGFVRHFPQLPPPPLSFPFPSLCSTHFSIYLMNFGFSRGTFHYYSWFIRALLYRSLRIPAQKCANCIWIILPQGLFNKHEVNNG